MNAASGAAVVVGVDGSEPAQRAVRLAAGEAARRGRTLRVVHGFVWPLLRVPLGPVPDAPPGAGLREQAERLVVEAVAHAESAAPGVRVTGEVIDGEASAVLVGESPTAALIVLGDRGLGGFAALAVGSVAIQVAAYADCPVLVARGADRADGPVVVGVDGSAAARAAVEFAADEATTRGVALRAVHAYRHPASGGPGDMQPLVYDEGQLRGEEERVLAAALVGLGDRRPAVRVERVLTRGRAAAALAEASHAAQLLVVGCRGRGELTGLLLGSVSHAVLHRADCPVAVVRAPV
ncbi:universal stress protein [Micromonospora sp. CA-111912]|uniref:universal stress protein n=1 Tax=Micromonospora sp. CA-111912 TaxID=3239955 RepID=UPI003D9142D5